MVLCHLLGFTPLSPNSTLSLDYSSFFSASSVILIVSKLSSYGELIVQWQVGTDVACWLCTVLFPLVLFPFLLFPSIYFNLQCSTVIFCCIHSKRTQLSFRCCCVVCAVVHTIFNSRPKNPSLLLNLHTHFAAKTKLR